MSSDKKIEYRISWLYGGLILALAIIYDLWELLVDFLGTALVIVFGFGLLFWILNFLTGIIAMLVFWLLFATKGIFLGKTPKRFLLTSITFIVEQIPGLDTALIATFGWTLGALLIILIERSEDRGGALSKITSLKNPKKGLKESIPAVGKS